MFCETLDQFAEFPIVLVLFINEDFDQRNSWTEHLHFHSASLQFDVNGYKGIVYIDEQLILSSTWNKHVK